jgi:hypothetical protein
MVIVRRLVGIGFERGEGWIAAFPASARRVAGIAGVWAARARHFQGNGIERAVPPAGGSW